MLLSRVLLAGPLEVPLAPPTEADSFTDEETFEVSGGVVTVCFTVDTLRTGAAGIAVSLCNPQPSPLSHGLDDVVRRARAGQLFWE